MPLNYTTITGTFDDGSGNALSGTVSFTPSETVYAASIPVASASNPVVFPITGGILQNCKLLATDNTGLSYEGLTGFFYWTVTVTLGGVSQTPWSFFLPHSPSTVDLYTLANTSAGGGGFTSPMTTLGDLIYENATPAAARLAGNTSTVKNFLTQTGNGTISAVPNWGTIAASDLPHQQPWQFYVSDYGAVGDGVTDDTAAVNSALAAAYAYAVANHGYYELIFGAKTYLIAGATSTGTLGVTGQCKAQLPLPVTATTAQKVTHVWRGVRDATALYHWQQTTVQSSGTVLKTTLNASSQFFAVGTEPSVVGGPLPANGYGSQASLFANDLYVLDGIAISTPTNPQICGFDFRGYAEANVINGACLVATSGLIGSIPAPTNAQQFGLAMPETNNNDNCNVQMWSAEGQNYGLIASEHTNIWSMRAIYCIAGLVASGQGSSTPHGMRVNYASVEACQIAVQFNYNSASPTKVTIDTLDYEGASGTFGSFHVINDPGNYGVGDISILNMTASTPRTSTFDPAANSTLNGGTGLRISAPDLPKGSITAPSVPATTVTLLNGAGADAAVTVTGGTVTIIKVDGVATGLTSGTVIVPKNKTIAITYSSVPSWSWVLF